MMPLRSICVHFIFMMIGINFSYICPNGGEKKPAMFCIAGQGIQIGRDLRAEPSSHSSVTGE